MIPHHANDYILEQCLVEDLGVLIVMFLGCMSRACDHFRPEIAPVAKHFHGRAKVLWINVDENPSIAKEFGVKAIPTTVVFRDGEKIAAYEGPYSREALIERITALMEPKKRKGS